MTIMISQHEPEQSAYYYFETEDELRYYLAQHSDMIRYREVKCRKKPIHPIHEKFIIRYDHCHIPTEQLNGWSHIKFVANLPTVSKIVMTVSFDPFRLMPCRATISVRYTNTHKPGLFIEREHTHDLLNVMNHLMDDFKTKTNAFISISS